MLRVLGTRAPGSSGAANTCDHEVSKLECVQRQQTCFGQVPAAPGAQLSTSRAPAILCLSYA